MSNVRVLPNRRARDTAIALETRGYRVDLRTGRVRRRRTEAADLYEGLCYFLRAQELMVASMIPTAIPKKPTDGGPDDAA